MTTWNFLTQMLNHFADTKDCMMLQGQRSKLELLSDWCNFSSEHKLCKWKAGLEKLSVVLQSYNICSRGNSAATSLKKNSLCFVTETTCTSSQEPENPGP